MGGQARSVGWENEQDENREPCVYEPVSREDTETWEGTYTLATLWPHSSTRSGTRSHVQQAYTRHVQQAYTRRTRLLYNATVVQRGAHDVLVPWYTTNHDCSLRAGGHGKGRATREGGGGGGSFSKIGGSFGY